jgi:hypothetical protein
MKLSKSLSFIPLIAMVLIAFYQIYITHTNRYLNPDKGAGFGLFSTVDKLNNRILLVYGYFDTTKVQINIPKNDPQYKKYLKKIWLDAQSYPTDQHLTAVAEELMHLKFSKVPDELYLEVKKCVFDTESADVRYEQVNSIRLPFTYKPRSDE